MEDTLIELAKSCCTYSGDEDDGYYYKFNDAAIHLLVSVIGNRRAFTVDDLMKRLETVKCTAPNHDMHDGFNGGIDLAISIIRQHEADHLQSEAAKLTIPDDSLDNAASEPEYTGFCSLTARERAVYHKAYDRGLMDAESAAPLKSGGNNATDDGKSMTCHESGRTAARDLPADIVERVKIAMWNSGVDETIDDWQANNIFAMLMGDAPGRKDGVHKANASVRTSSPAMMRFLDIVMSDELVERVAKALWEKQKAIMGPIWFHPSEKWEGIPYGAQNEWIELAKAAIKAMGDEPATGNGKKREDALGSSSPASDQQRGYSEENPVDWDKCKCPLTSYADGLHRHHLHKDCKGFSSEMRYNDDPVMEALRFYADRGNYLNSDDGNKYHEELEKLTGGEVCLQITDAAGQDCGEKARSALDYLRTPEPVMVNLYAGFYAMAKTAEKYNTSLGEAYGKSLAKACADAWGLKYVD